MRQTYLLFEPFLCLSLEYKYYIFYFTKAYVCYWMLATQHTRTKMFSWSYFTELYTSPALARKFYAYGK